MLDYPLNNKQIIVTQAFESTKLNTELSLKRAKVVHLPLIKVEKKQLSIEQKSLINSLTYFDYVIFTSKNGIIYFYDYLKEIGVKMPKHVKIIVVGQATQKVLQQYGADATILNPGTTAKDLATYLLPLKELQNRKILLVQGNLAPDFLHTKLSKIATVERINVYKTGIPGSIDQKILQQIIRNSYDLITFTSPSAFFNLLAALPDNFDPKSLKVATIGKVTNEALLQKDVEALIIAKVPDMKAFANDIESYYRNN